MIPSPRARLGAIAATIALAAASGLLSSAPALAGPVTLDFTPPRDGGLSGGSIELGTPQGEPSCSGEGDARTCTQAMGISTSYSGSAGIRDVNTGSDGTLSVTCTVMYAGTYTIYATREGEGNAVGSEDCTLQLNFANGDQAWGAMHQARILTNNIESSTMAFTFTGGVGRYAGFNGSFSISDSQAWQAPPPIGDTPMAVSRVAHRGPTAGVASLITGVRSGLVRDGEQSIKVPYSAKRIVDVTSLGLLAPKNGAAKVVVAAAAGSSCSAVLSAGSKRISLPAKAIGAKSASVDLGSLASGKLAGVDKWTLTVSCTLKGKTTKTVRTLKTFEVLTTKLPV